MGLELAVSNISKSYDKEHVLKECSFFFDKGEMYVLMGHNGSGKSTFLRISSLLEEPDKGEVIFYSNGLPVKKDIELKRRITLLLPRVVAFDTTVYENIVYGLRIRGLKGKDIEERVDKALDLVGLAHKKDRRAPTLSSGEIQRLGIARAIVIEPEIIFLDEPTASVDQKNTEFIEDILLKMKKNGRAIIVTTHDMIQAERLGGRLLMMQNGKLVERIL